MAVKHIRATAVEPEFLTLSIVSSEDGVWQGGLLDIDIANVTLIGEVPGSRDNIVCGLTLSLMRSDLETIMHTLKENHGW